MLDFNFFYKANFTFLKVLDYSLFLNLNCLMNLFLSYFNSNIIGLLSFIISIDQLNYYPYLYLIIKKISYLSTVQ